MRAEELFEAIGDVEDAMVEEARTPRGRKKWAALVACACVVLAVGLFLADQTMPPEQVCSLPLPEEETAARETEAPPESAEESTTAVTEEAAVYTRVPIGDRIAAYEKVAEGNSGELSEGVGAVYLREGETTWYQMASSENLGYLVRPDESGQRSLWVFRSFLVLDDALVDQYGYLDGDQEAWQAERSALEGQYPDADFSPYTYGEMLAAIYHVDGPEDIASVTALPSNADNTDRGKAIQKEIGVHSYEDSAEIRVFYHALADTVCYGESDWAVYSSIPDRFTYSFSTGGEDKFASGEETYGARYLIITLTDGTTINSLKYNALKGCFYEFGGICSEELPEDTVTALNGIFEIK